MNRASFGLIVLALAAACVGEPAVGAGGSGTESEGTSDASSGTDSQTSLPPDDTTGPGPSTCGNGVVEGDEGCDDGNGNNGDDCPDGTNGSCQPAACGDGFVQAGVEACDDGNTTPGDGCDETCDFEGTCGDGVVGLNEECDNGANNDDVASGACPDVCRTSCLCPACGDGVTDTGEDCDDGNTDDGDGCSATCSVEAPANCGDGVLDPPLEECDDGNTADGDGCDSACQFEPLGLSCGDGMVDPLEKCDDSNVLNGDGCNPTCNFLTEVTQLATNVPGSVIISDGTYLYLFGGNSNCQIHRAEIATCTPGSCPFTPYIGAGGCGGTPTDGPGATAVIGGAGSGLAFGVDRIYFSDTHTIREVDLSSPTLDVTTLAGDPTRCGQLDGIGNMAVMSDIRAFYYYGGLIYFVDANMATLRQLDPATGEVLTLAGQTPNDNSGSGYSCGANLCCGNMAPAVDDFGTNAVMNSPRYMSGDNSGNIFIVDTNGNAIRQYDIATTFLSTVIAGNGYADGVGPAAGMDRPRGVTSDGTSIYFGEQNLNTLRQLELATATTSTFVGVRGCAGPANLAGGVGGDGTQDWGGMCNDPAVASMPQFDVGIASLAYDYGAQTIFAVLTGNRLVRVD